MKKRVLFLVFLFSTFVTALFLFSSVKNMGVVIGISLLSTINFLASYYAIKFHTPKIYLKGAPQEYAKRSLSFVESPDFSALLQTVTGSKNELVPILKAAILVPPLILAYRADTASADLSEREGMTSFEMKSLLNQEFDDIPKDDIKYQLAMRIQHYLGQISRSERDAFLARIFAYVDSKPPTEELLDWRRSVPSSLAGHTN